MYINDYYVIKLCGYVVLCLIMVKWQLVQLDYSAIFGSVMINEEKYNKIIFRWMMKKQNKIKISKKLIVNIKYDLVQCKQINIACRIHLLNRKKRFLFNICNNNFQLAGSFNNTKFQCTSRVVFLWWLKQFVNKWRPLSQKAYQKSAYIYHKRTDRKIMQDF